MTRLLPMTPGRCGRTTATAARRAAASIASASVLLMLTLAPASAIDKKSSLSDAGSPAAAAAGMDPPQNETIKKVAQLIDTMGYTVKGSGADYLVVDANNFVVALEPAGDNSAVYASIYFQVPKEKRQMMPYEKILDYNGHSADYFGTSKGANDSVSIALMNHLSMAVLSPHTLKDLIDQVTSDANRNIDLIDPSSWKSSLPDFTSK